MGVVLSIGDTHAPFMHRDAVRFLMAVAKEYKPDVVISQGDLTDQHFFSRFTSSTKGEGGKKEMEDAADQLCALKSAFPKLFICWGNHDLRIVNKAQEAGIDENFLRSYADILDFPKGWQIGDRWVVDDVVYEHGIGRSGAMGALKAAMANMQSTVIGHIHSHAGIQYYANKQKLIYGFNVGCLVDDHKYAFEYARFQTCKSILGCGIIINGVPIFIPMVINKKHRWIGKLL